MRRPRNRWRALLRSIENVFFPIPCRDKMRIALSPAWRRIFFSEVTMRILITAAMFSVLALSPASAKMMACTAANIGTSAQAMEPGQTAANKEIAAANTDVSNGKMRSACKHYMNAQKLSMAK
jgi:hypothetical protein